MNLWLFCLEKSLHFEFASESMAIAATNIAQLHDYWQYT